MVKSHKETHKEHSAPEHKSHAAHHATHAHKEASSSSSHAHAHHETHASKSHSTHQAPHHAAHHAKKPVKKSSNNYLWQGVVLVLAVLLILAIFTHGFSTLHFKKQPKTVDQVSNKLPIDLYVMSQCPYGVQAENTMFEAIKKIGLENFDVNLEFIGGDAGNNQYSSLHGPNEVQGDKVQLCAKSVDETKLLDFVLCMDKDASSIPTNWESCADKVGLDKEAVRTCYEGDEANKLLSDSFAASTAAGASGSPTIFVNKKPYNSGRQTIDFERAFCTAFGNEQPTTCADVPKPAEVNLIVLNDKTCGSACDATQITQASQQLFPGLVLKEVDVSSKEGKDLVEKYNIDIVPVYIFDKGVEQSSAWQQPQFSTNFNKLSDGSYSLKDEVTGANYYIDPAKRAAREQAMGVDTSDGKPDFDFFVMSYCPYGNQAEELIKKVYDTLGDTVDFKPHYIFYENYQGGGDTYCFDNDSKYCSMHGVQEARQDIREECVLDKYGIGAWFDFATAMNDKCSAQNADTCYESIATDLGYDLSYIKSCEADKANEYGAKNAELMKLFGAQGSPAIYLNGKQYAGARDANSMLKALCDAFPEGSAPSECSSVIENATPSNSVPAGSCG